MISIVICSRNPDLSNELKLNIASTIGCLYEIVMIDNSRNEFNIFSAYNEGVKRSKGEIICFMHEDILFHTNDWGLKVFRHFDSNKNTGLIGVIGGLFFPRHPCAWWHSATETGQLIQGIVDENGDYDKFEEYLWNRKPHGAFSMKAVAVDGLWMCIRRELFEHIRFDDLSFHGFHLYDADICMQIISCGYDVRIVFDILIEHMSGGVFSPDFFNALEDWYQKWKTLLPISRGIELSETEFCERVDLCKRYADLQKSQTMLMHRIEMISESYSYKIGRLILKPIKNFKSVIMNLQTYF